jgi:hypothetical protein
MNTITQTKSFQTACCEQFGCNPDEYERVVFWHCLHGHAVVPARVIHWVCPSFFEGDLELLRTVARSADLNELGVELNNYRYQQRATGLVRGVLRVRISGQRILNLGARVFAGCYPESRQSRTIRASSCD